MKLRGAMVHRLLADPCRAFLYMINNGYLFESVCPLDE